MWGWGEGGKGAKSEKGRSMLGEEEDCIELLTRNMGLEKGSGRDHMGKREEGNGDTQSN